MREPFLVKLVDDVASFGSVHSISLLLLLAKGCQLLCVAVDQLILGLIKVFKSFIDFVYVTWFLPQGSESQHC